MNTTFGMLFRSLRKKAYTFERHPSPVARAALQPALAGYRLADRLVLRRATKPDLFAEKLISHRAGFLGVLVPKSASRTIMAGLRRAAQGSFDLTISEASIARFTSGYDDYFTFAFVRDPWARCYSCYKQKFRRDSPLKMARTFHGRRRLDPTMSFADFVHWLCSDDGGDAFADRHWMSQYRVLGLDLGVEYDFIGTVDTFRRDVERLTSWIGVDPGSFAHKLRSTEAGEHLWHYTPELAEMVAHRYARDVDLFGFEPPVIPD